MAHNGFSVRHNHLSTYIVRFPLRAANHEVALYLSKESKDFIHDGAVYYIT